MPVNTDRVKFVADALDTAKGLGNYFAERQKETDENKTYEIWLGLQGLLLHLDHPDNPLVILSAALPSKERKELDALAKDFNAVFIKERTQAPLSLAANLACITTTNLLCKYISLAHEIYSLQKDRINLQETSNTLSPKQQRLHDVFTKHNDESSVIFSLIINMVKTDGDTTKSPYEEFLACFRSIDEFYPKDLQEQSIQKLMVIDKFISRFPQDTLAKHMNDFLQNLVKAHESDEQKTKVSTQSSPSSGKISFFQSSQSSQSSTQGSTPLSDKTSKHS